MKKSNRNKERKQEETRWREGMQNENSVKDGSEEDLERSNISGTILYE